MQGNQIGTDITGTQGIDNGQNGVEIDAGADNTIGGNSPGAGNVISSDFNDGVLISGAGATGNLVQGNMIGIDITGTQYIGNYVNGVEIDGGADNTIGGTAPGAGNVISGNSGDGVLISGAGATGDLVQGNMIGTDITGTQGLLSFLGNELNGVEIDGGADNTIGGTAAGAGNVISDNFGDGVLIYGDRATGNVVQGNRIGTDGLGLADLLNSYGNAQSGVEVEGGVANTIGGTSPGAGNVISGNSGDGVLISGGTATGNLVQGNLIGTDITGTEPIGNDLTGVEIDDSADNTIGGTTPGAGNLIAANDGPGVVVKGDTSVGDEIIGNRIFDNSRQAIDLGDDGVTYNAASPRVGPNNDQNFPVVVTTSGGQLEGWLEGSAPNTLFLIQVFASSQSGPGGAGEAEAYLGSLEVTTDRLGQAIFDIPLTRAGRLADHQCHRHGSPGQHLRGLGPPPDDPRGAGAGLAPRCWSVGDLLGRAG